MTMYEKRLIEIMVQKEVDKKTAMEAVDSMDTIERQKLLLQFVEMQTELTRPMLTSEVIRILMTTTAEDEITLDME